MLAGSFPNTAAAPAIGRISALQNATLVFDVLLNAWLHFSGGLTNNVPVEVRLGFAKKCGVDYWHNFPAFYDDASAL